MSAVVVGCGGVSDEATTERWEQAQAAWRRGDIDAFQQWTDLGTESVQGREAAARLASADAHYREGVRLLEIGDPHAREELAAGVAVAPMNPELYLPLARACRQQGITLRAAEYYSKYLATAEGPEAERARAELRELDPQLADVLGPVEGIALVPATPPQDNLWWAAISGVVVGMVLAATLFLIVQYVRGRGISLERLVAQSPEFHPAVAYLVGSLRHELLKHRIGAASDALAQDAPSAIAFLRGRLFEGQPLVDAWEGHLVAFRRAIGPRVDLARDPHFRRAGRAVRAIARLEEGLRPEVDEGTQRRALERLSEAHHTLVAFDTHLAAMVHGLVRTQVDAALFREVVESVCAEHSAGQVELSDVDVSAPQEEVVLEVFRADLVLVLKNVVRNAILAVGRHDVPRRLRVDALVELEATGDETVRIRVFDSSPEALDPSVIFDRRVDRGLGLVAAAVHRYGGTIDVEEASGDYRKAVVVSFFRADEAL
ncbi:MAG: ATP-binding protein [Myxococcota bacterium]